MEHKSETSIRERNVSDPLLFMQQRMSKSKPRISLAEAGDLIIAKAIEAGNPISSVSMQTTPELIRKIIQEDGGRVRVARKFCEDPNITLFFYNVPKKRFTGTAGLYGYKISDNYLSKNKDQVIFV